MPMSTSMIADRLREYRKERQLTTQDVSLYLKDKGYQIEARSIYGYEDGSRKPNAEVFLHLCQLYGCADVLFEFGCNEGMVKDAFEEQHFLNQYRKLTDKEKYVLGVFLDSMIITRNKRESDSRDQM